MKSKFVFLILFLGYILIAMGDLTGIVTAGQEILFGLSLSALLMSLSDCATAFKILLCQKNEMRYITKCSSYFIDVKLEQNTPSANLGINIRNVKKNLEDENPHYQKSKHPNEFNVTSNIKFLNSLEIIFFVVSIFTFVVFPFLKISFEVISKATIFVTLIAFGFMCLNVFISEFNSELSTRRFNFIHNTQIHINSVYTDFYYWLNNQLFFTEDLKAAQKNMEDNSNFKNVDINTTNLNKLD